MPERTGIVTRAGHICMICGFLPTTKNKYRELQDHLVRKHFNDRIKAVLPTRRPYMCPEPNCTIEGKDWQALMRHYTGKHGVLEAFLREIIDNGLQLPQNPKIAKKKQKQRQQQLLKQQLQQQKQQQRLQQQLLQQQTPLPPPQAPSVSPSAVLEATSPCPPQAALISPNLAPERIGARRKRPSHNSTGSASSPESVAEDDDPSKPQQLALIVKRSLPNGEDAIALIDLKCFLASSTYIPNPEPKTLTAAAGENAHFNVLADESFAGAPGVNANDRKSPIPPNNNPVITQHTQPPQQQQPVLLSPQLTAEQQASPLYPLIQEEVLSQQQQQLQLQQQQLQHQSQHQQEQELQEIEQHLQISNPPPVQQQEDQVPVQIATEYAESFEQVQCPAGTEIIELSNEMYDQQSLVPIYVTPSGEVVHIPLLNQVQVNQDGEAFQIVQAVPAQTFTLDQLSQPVYELQTGQPQGTVAQANENCEIQQQQQPVTIVNNNPPVTINTVDVLNSSSPAVISQEVVLAAESGAQIVKDQLSVAAQPALVQIQNVQSHPAVQIPSETSSAPVVSSVQLQAAQPSPISTSLTPDTTQVQTLNQGNPVQAQTIVLEGKSQTKLSNAEIPTAVQAKPGQNSNNNKPLVQDHLQGEKVVEMDSNSDDVVKSKVCEISEETIAATSTSKVSTRTTQQELSFGMY